MLDSIIRYPPTVINHRWQATSTSQKGVWLSTVGTYISVSWTYLSSLDKKVFESAFISFHIIFYKQIFIRVLLPKSNQQWMWWLVWGNFLLSMNCMNSLPVWQCIGDCMVNKWKRNPCPSYIYSLSKLLLVVMTAVSINLWSTYESSYIIKPMHDWSCFVDCEM